MSNGIFISIANNATIPATTAGSREVGKTKQSEQGDKVENVDSASTGKDPRQAHQTGKTLNVSA